MHDATVSASLSSVCRVLAFRSSVPYLPLKGGVVMLGRPLPEDPTILDWLLRF